MTTFEAREMGKQDLMNALEAAGVKEGRMQKQPSADEWTYWNLVKKEILEGLRQYVTFTIIDTQEWASADDEPFSFDFLAVVDVWSLESFENKPLIEFLNYLEKKLRERGFSIKIGSEMRNDISMVYHLPITIEKEIF